MTCLIDRILDGAGMKSHASWPFVCRFSRKNIHWNVWDNFQTFHCSNVMLQWKGWNSFPGFSGRIFFLENWYTQFQGVYKKCPQQRRMWPHPCPVQNFVYQASHCSTLLIGWLNLCSRVYIETRKDRSFRSYYRQISSIPNKNRYFCCFSTLILFMFDH